MARLTILAFLSVLLALPSASARHPQRIVPVGATAAGFVIVATPDVVETAQGRLTTRAVFWQLRALYRVLPSSTQTVLAEPDLPVRLRRGTRDTEVMVKRAWKTTDVRRQSRLFTDVTRAVKKFRSLRFSRKITALSLPEIAPPDPLPSARPTIDVRGHAPHEMASDLRHESFRAPTCEDTLLKKGHAAFHLRQCRGIPPQCAVALLENGHNPIHLSQCKRGQNMACAVELLRQGHSPIHLSACAGIRRTNCALGLLERGDSPIHLQNCR